MQYCKKCKHMYEEQTVCPDCKRELSAITDKDTPVFLLSAGGFEYKRVSAALEEADIPATGVPQKRSFSADAVTGLDTTEYDILVPYDFYEKAYDLCVGIGAIKPEGVTVEETPDEPVSEEVPMSPAKRTTVKIVSAILLILLFCAVIWGTDALTGLIRGFFS